MSQCVCGKSFYRDFDRDQHQRAKKCRLRPHRLADDPDVEDWHAMGRALIAIGERAKAGEPVDITHEAAALGIPPERLVRSLRAQRAPVPARA